MRRTRLAACGAAAIVGLAAPAARADVDAFLGKPIVSVRLIIENRESLDPALVNVVETRVGRPLLMAEVRESETHLFSLGRFEDIRVDATMTEGGVALRYDLRPIHPVSRIEFHGALAAPGVDEGRLRRGIVDRFGFTPPTGRGAEIERVVADMLRDSGYLNARVTARYVTEHAPERATLVIDVAPAERTRIGTVEVGGSGAAQARDLTGQLRLVAGAPYERQTLQDRIDRYVEGLRKRGYYEAKIDPVVRISDDRRVADIALAVEPGPRVRVVFAGDPLPGDRRADLVPIEREGSADEDLLEDSSNRIEEYLRGLGYRDATAPHTREQKDGELIITFTVKRGAEYRVGKAEISGNSAVALSEFETALRLRAGQPFSQAKLDADLSTITGLYRRRGFATVKATPSLDPIEVAGGAQLLDVRIVIAEGVRTVVSAVRIEGNQSVPDATLRQRIGLEAGKPFFAAQVAADRDALQIEYQNQGYANATVDARQTFNADQTRADVVYSVREGPRIFVDHVLIVGNVRISDKTILRALQIKPGDPLGQSAVNDAQQRLASLGLFRRTDIRELRHGNETTRDLLVTVDEAPATTIGYGAGGEVRARVVQTADGGVATERLEFAPRASFQIGRRNLFGKNRSVDLFTSVSLHPKDTTGTQPAGPLDTGYGFTEYRVNGSFREPRLFDTVADAYLTASLEQQIRSSFKFARRTASAGIARRLSRDVSITGNYQIQRTRLFDEEISPSDQLDIDRLFPQVLVSSFSTSIIRDTRDDQVDARSGTYLSANGQLAARAIGSEVGFAKSFFTAQAFHTVPNVSRLVVAGSARLGIAAGFPRDVQATDIEGRPIVQTVEDLPISERFFAGGDTTVRGFALDRLGIRHSPPQADDTIDKDGFPKGGNGLVILNAELRASLKWGVSAVGFLDGGNVFAHASDIDPLSMRGSVGFGARWKSPLGPFRIDIGYKLHRNEIAPGVRETPREIWFSFGQAF